MAEGFIPLLLTLALSAGAAQSESQTETETEIGTVPLELRAARERERVTRLEVEAAQAGEFYLIADAGASRLRFCLSGVVLATYRTDRIDLGLPPAEGAPSGEELNALYHCQAPVLHPPAELRPGEAAVPPEPNAKAEESTEKADRIGRVSVDCGPSLALRLVSSSSLGWIESLRERLRLSGDPQGAVRMRIVLPEEDAERLFASLPPKLLFFVSRVPETSATAASTATTATTTTTR
jgi:hypothetical protein